MNKKAVIKFELEYDLESMRFMVGEDFPVEQFEERVWDYAYHDLQDLMRSEDLPSWSKMEVSDVV